MKCLLTTTLAAVLIALNAQAELTPKEFAQVEAWAADRSYFYEGDRTSYGVDCFVFANQAAKVVAWVPASSDTADEAINALIASAITCRVLWNTAVGEKYLEISSPEGVSPATRASASVMPKPIITTTTNQAGKQMKRILAIKLAVCCHAGLGG